MRDRTQELHEAARKHAALYEDDGFLDGVDGEFENNNQRENSTRIDVGELFMEDFFSQVKQIHQQLARIEEMIASVHELETSILTEVDTRQYSEACDQQRMEIQHLSKTVNLSLKSQAFFEILKIFTHSFE